MPTPPPPPPVTFDPLAAQRRPDGPAFDLFLNGMVFLDIIFTGLPGMPAGGREVWADGMGSCPGGIANLAVAASRLGLRTSLGAAFGDDDYGEFCWRTLEQEGVDLSRSRRYPGWHSPVTVSIAVDGDRNMITHGHEAPQAPSEMIGRPPRTRAVMMDLSAHHPGESLGASWADAAYEDGALIFADVCVASADQPLKGVPVLLRALARVREEHPGVRLTLVSKLKRKGEAARLLDKLGLRDAVDLVSGVDDDELADLVGSAEIAVVPSMYEGFSLPAVEAMSSGCALVATRAGALPEVVGTDDSAARLVEPGDVDALAREISALLSDPAERQRLSQGGRARVMERYSWAAVARRTVEVYEAAIARVRGDALPDLTAGPVLGPDQTEIDEHVTDDVPEVLPESGEYTIREQEDATC